ncbi:type II toxin-antitoxin system VapB family antitoxin [Salinibacterium sp. SWN1162]|uniref:type II toxin-antitoxin system VapB family antitoxin n=1 Tax=Salinibacterium sp. SWN1162 TaxID=2792053 RepID=UPI0018CCB92A|nr:type II toxin-antitoxin system VapB family antitoxin [Salinibacterium sp. SWN1162]MBH0008153.1 type II toxin-antitoxin system VapB family antitoxin [Salinibacterium sp. SWN1162]
MTVTSIDIDPTELRTARDLTGSRSNRETVDLALRTLIALRRQPAAVERIIGRTFDDDQIDAPTSRPTAK